MSMPKLLLSATTSLVSYGVAIALPVMAGGYVFSSGMIPVGLLPGAFTITTLAGAAAITTLKVVQSLKPLMTDRISYKSFKTASVFGVIGTAITIGSGIAPLALATLIDSPVVGLLAPVYGLCAKMLLDTISYIPTPSFKVLLGAVGVGVAGDLVKFAPPALVAQVQVMGNNLLARGQGVVTAVLDKINVVKDIVLNKVVENLPSVEKLRNVGWSIATAVGALGAVAVGTKLVGHCTKAEIPTKPVVNLPLAQSTVGTGGKGMVASSSSLLPAPLPLPVVQKKPKAPAKNIIGLAEIPPFKPVGVQVAKVELRRVASAGNLAASK
jgi:hypothetical protein